MKKYMVELTTDERGTLHQLVAKGKSKARKLTHARILLKADRGQDAPPWTDEDISAALDVSLSTVAHIRQRFVEEGLEAALHRKKQVHHRQKCLDGEGEARLITLACSPAPDGYARWTLRLLADRMVELDYAEHLSYQTVRRTLKKNELKPHLKKQWCIPPQQNADFVWHMEDILDVYTRPYDPLRPQVCMDETSKQLVGETRQPLPVGEESPLRYDYEYQRNGVCNLFMFFEPLSGKRYVKVTQTRTKQDWAYCIADLVEIHYPDAEKIVLVMDNLNTHTP